MNFQLKLLTSGSDLKLLDQIYNVTKSLEICYPNHRHWFYNKFIKGLNSGQRVALFVEKDNVVVGVVLLKCCEEEKKICTIFVDERYRNNGIGSSLLKKAFEILGTTKPFITISKEKIKQFENIIKKYDWSLGSIYKDLYTDGKEEWFYNERKF